MQALFPNRKSTKLWAINQDKILLHGKKSMIEQEL